MQEPIFTYICGSQKSSMKLTLLEKLSHHYFVQTNSDIKKHFVASCYAITQSKAFIFIMDEHTINNDQCLTLLGTAIAYDVPVISIRTVGYALPNKLSKLYEEMDIIDRSKINDLSKKNSQLPTVTTLDNALKTLFNQSVLFHERMLKKCVNDIQNTISKVKFKVGVYTRYTSSSLNKQKSIESRLSNCSPIQAASHIDRTISPSLTIEPYPLNVLPKSNKYRKNMVGKQEVSDWSNNTTRKTYNFPKKNKNSISQARLQNASSAKRRNHITSVTKNIMQEQSFLLQENIKLEMPDVNSTDEKPEERKLKKPQEIRLQLRRSSSVPNIPTNYLVAEGDKDSLKVYRFPLSPNTLRKKPSFTLSPRISFEENDSYIHISRINSPIDFFIFDEDNIVLEKETGKTQSNQHATKHINTNTNVNA